MDDKSPAYENFMNKMSAMNSGPKIKMTTMKMGGLEKRVANNERKITAIKNIFKAQKIDIGDKIAPTTTPLQTTLEETNEILTQVGSILSADFKERLRIEKEDQKLERKRLLGRRRQNEEDDLEGTKKANKKIGGLISTTAKKITSPFKGIFDKIISFLGILGTGVLINSAFEFFGKKENRDKFKGAFNWLTENWNLVIGGIAAIVSTGVVLSLIGSLASLGGLFVLLTNPVTLAALGVLALFAGGIFSASLPTSAEETARVLREQYGGDRLAMIEDLEKILTYPDEELSAFGKSANSVRTYLKEQIYFLKTGKQFRYGFGTTDKDRDNAEYIPNLDFSQFSEPRPFFGLRNPFTFSDGSESIKQLQPGDPGYEFDNMNFNYTDGLSGISFLDLPPIDLSNSQISGDYSGFSATDVFDYDATDGFNSYMLDVPNLLYGDLD